MYCQYSAVPSGDNSLTVISIRISIQIRSLPDLSLGCRYISSRSVRTLHSYSFHTRHMLGDVRRWIAYGWVPVMICFAAIQTLHTVQLVLAADGSGRALDTFRWVFLHPPHDVTALPAAAHTWTYIPILHATLRRRNCVDG